MSVPAAVTTTAISTKDRDHGCCVENNRPMMPISDRSCYIAFTTAIPSELRSDQVSDDNNHDMAMTMATTNNHNTIEYNQRRGPSLESARQAINHPQRRTKTRKMTGRMPLSHSLLTCTLHGPIPNPTSYPCPATDVLTHCPVESQPDQLRLPIVARDDEDDDDTGVPCTWHSWPPCERR